MFSFFYQNYIRIMAHFGGYRPKAVAKMSASEATAPTDYPATNYGSEYRGAGVFTGLLGICIVFAAIAPGAFALETDRALQVFGLFKVIMMFTMLFVVKRIGGAKGLKQDWINSRVASEKQRYRALEKVIVELKGSLDQASSNKVREELLRVLEGADGQIYYNSNKADQYEAIEHATELLGTVIFYVALLAAIGLLLSEFHIFRHQSWLILFTAFLPAALGGFHGINGFLTVGTLATDHRKMQFFLSDALTNLGNPNANDPATVLTIAIEVAEGLNSRDHEWKEKTNEGNNLSLA